jgi:hypothetical protein
VTAAYVRTAAFWPASYVAYGLPREAERRPPRRRSAGPVLGLLQEQHVGGRRRHAVGRGLEGWFVGRPLSASATAREGFAGGEIDWRPWGEEGDLGARRMGRGCVGAWGYVRLRMFRFLGKRFF